MRPLRTPSRLRYRHPLARLLAFLLLMATASTLPASLAGEAHLCLHAGAEHTGAVEGESGGEAGHPGHHGHHSDPSPEGSGETGTPAQPCTCPHPCGPCADVVDPPSASRTWVFLAQSRVAWVPGWDISSLPPMDPRRIPTGPDPPATPRS